MAISPSLPGSNRLHNRLHSTDGRCTNVNQPASSVQIYCTEVNKMWHLKTECWNVHKLLNLLVIRVSQLKSVNVSKSDTELQLHSLIWRRKNCFNGIVSVNEFICLFTVCFVTVVRAWIVRQSEESTSLNYYYFRVQ